VSLGQGKASVPADQRRKSLRVRRRRELREPGRASASARPPGAGLASGLCEGSDACAAADLEAAGERDDRGRGQTGHAALRRQRANEEAPAGVTRGEFVRDPSHWLRRLSPDEWIRAALGELGRAEAAYGHGNARAGSAGVKRAAGMALNGALLVQPDEG